MNDNVDFAVAIDVVNRKIAELNIKISLNNNEELNEELDKYLKVKQEIFDGNSSLVKKIIDGEII